MNKTVEYYLGLPYTIELIPEPEGGWFVAVKELPGCMSEGDTPEEAVEMIRDAMHGWIEVSLEDGDPIPEPRMLEDYSGKFVVRLPRSLHRDLVEMAGREGVSLNQYVNVALGRALGRLAPAGAAAPEEPAWPGLKTSVGQVLTVAGFAQDAGELDERLFASWLDSIFHQVESALQGGYLRDALGYLEELALRLRASTRRNPVLAAFSRMVLLLCGQIESRAELQQGVMNDLMIRSRISQYVRGTLAERVIQEERIAYSETSTERIALSEYAEQWPGPSKRAAQW